MGKISKLMKFVRFNKETVLNENETETTCLDKASESIEDIDCSINQLLKNPPPYSVLWVYAL
jgi:hypothetical protein